MSEEILKALMQLFAIIAKQDNGVALEEREYVQHFLRLQLEEETVQEYLALFDDFAGIMHGKPIQQERKRTSTMDSMRTLGICRKIGETLTQEQKVVVLVRLFEMLTSTKQFTEQRVQIIETSSMMFNMPDEEYSLIRSFVTEDDISKLDHETVMVINDQEDTECENCKHLTSHKLGGNIIILWSKSTNLYFLRYTGKSEVYLNGLLTSNKNIQLFATGSTIKVPSGKPIFYSDVVSNFQVGTLESNISFTAENVNFNFPNGNIGLREMNISEEHGKLIGIMGSSGAGKTTLLNVLAGLEEPTTGILKINGIDIHNSNGKLEGVTGFIPQDDLLIEELTVYDNLYFNTKLCFKDLSEEGIDELVMKILGSLGLTETKDLKVGSPLDKTISGGQRKRLNIGLEIIREPSILFVDEPTSGLSSRDSENVIDLLRELSLKGKLIFVVIHQPSSDIYKTFDRIIFLDTGGHLIYYGNPVEAIAYFRKADGQINSEVGECIVCGTVSPESIFNIIEAKVVDEFGKFTDQRRRSPAQWATLYNKNVIIDEIQGTTDIPEKILQIPSWAQQLKIFSARDLLSKLSNKQYLLLNLFETPVLAFILSYIIRYIDNPLINDYKYRDNDNIPSYIFMSIIVILFIGLTVSAEEIYRDRKILKRESFLNLSRSSYLLSKMGILFGLSFIQTFMFVMIGNTVLGIEDMNIAYWAMLFSTSCLANLLGLNISATFNSAVTIYIIIPLLIIPQMVLGGAMFDFEKLNKSLGGGAKVPFIAELMPSRWAYEGLMVHQFMNNYYEYYFYDVEQKESLYDYKQVYYLPELEDIVGEYKSLTLEATDSATKEAAELMLLLNNEISELVDQEKDMKFEYVSHLTPNLFTAEVASETLEYLDKLSIYYSAKFNAVNEEKERRIMKLKKRKDIEYNYNNLRDSYFNEFLADEIMNKLTRNKILRINNRLVQNYDPIYREPNPDGILSFRTHFYAPSKSIFGQLIPTFIFNLIVIWIMTIILYLTLYYEVFKKAFDAFNNLKIGKG